MSNEMTTQIEIKNYQEGFEIKQAELGAKVTNDWQGFNQTPADQLKNSYSQDSFDPETRFYAFQGDELVGFVTATIQPTDPEKSEDEVVARMEFPIAREDDPIITQKLLDEAFARLKEKGVVKVHTRASKDWGKTRDYVQQFGYTHLNPLQRMGFASITSDGPADENLKRMEGEEDRQVIVDFMKEIYGLTDEQIEQQFTIIENNKDRIVGFYFYEIKGEVHSILAPMRRIDDPDTVVIPSPALRSSENEDLLWDVLDALSHELGTRGISQLGVALFGPSLQQQEQYMQRGFDFSLALDMYVRDL